MPQRLRLLRTYLLLKLIYRLVFGRLTAGRLQSLDREVRSAVRSWLKLPPSSKKRNNDSTMKDYQKSLTPDYNNK